MDGGQGFETVNTSAEPDYDRYAPYIDDLDLSLSEQRELMGVVWSIMTAFADMGFGIEPTQLICGWIEETRRKVPKTSSDAVKWEGSKTQQTFNRVAHERTGESDSDESQ